MSKYGLAKERNVDDIWRSALWLETIAEQETGVTRSRGEDLLIERVDAAEALVVQSLSYSYDRFGGRWPVLTTMAGEGVGDDYDVFTLLSLDDARHEIYTADKVRSYTGADAVERYMNRILRTEAALRSTVVSHYVEFEGFQIRYPD